MAYCHCKQFPQMQLTILFLENVCDYVVHFVLICIEKTVQQRYVSMRCRIAEKSNILSKFSKHRLGFIVSRKGTVEL